MKKVIYLGGFLLVLLVWTAQGVLAARVRVSRGTGTGKSTSSGGGVQSSAKFRADRRAVILTLSGLASVKSVSYQLTYTADGIPQGVMGTVQPTGGTESRELLFGTCSKNVCRYHNNIRDARLVVTFKLKSGATIRKPYRLKI